MEEAIATGESWDNYEMSAFFYVGHGAPRTLESMGHLDLIRDYYNANYLQRFMDQIRLKAESTPDGSINDEFRTPYSFYDALFSYGDSTMSGQFAGEIKTIAPGQRAVSGIASFLFFDEFKDPIDLRKILVGVLNALNPFETYTEKEFEMAWAEVGGQIYPIRGSWTMQINEILEAT